MKTKKIGLLFYLLLLGSIVIAQDIQQTLPTYFPKGSVNLRTNSISWLCLVPSLGIEYKTSDHIGLLIDGAYAHWNLNTANEYWCIWNVSPQIRYYTGNEKGSYIGGKYTMGDYNFTGKQGNFMGGGFTLGHQFEFGKNILVDLGLSIGYLYLYDKEKYTRINGVNVRNGSKTSNGYWGPIGANATFVWKIN